MSMFKKPKDPTTPTGLGPMNFGLAPAPGVRVSQLQGIPSIQIPQGGPPIQTAAPVQHSQNDLLLKLLGFRM